MPIVIDRRAFLTGALAAGFAARLRADVPAPTRWALLSDVHCPQDPTEAYRGLRPHESLKKVAKEVAASDAQFCAISGDLARLTGNPGDYDALKELLQPVLDKIPVGMSLGNHDHRLNFQKVFATTPGKRLSAGRKHVVAVEWTDLRAVFLDSLLETNVTPGQLGNAQRQAMADYVRADQRPVLLFLHHDFRDADGSLVDAPKLLQLIAPLKQVKAVFYGHSHEYHTDQHEGIHLVNVPSTAYNFRPQDPVGWLEMTVSKKGANLLLKAFAGNTELNGTKARLDWR
jgi:3',5'-cyclic AMP phosphodiesterase CpdA